MHKENKLGRDILVFENENCIISNKQVIELLKSTIDRIRKGFDELNKQLEEDEEKQEKRSMFNFNPHSGVLEAINASGVLLYKDIRLWIVPKILARQNPSSSEIRERTLVLLYHMTSYVEGRRKIAVAIPRRGDPLLILAGLYIDILSDELKRGVYREYIRTRVEARFIRGRLLVEELLRRCPQRLHVPITEYWQLSIDVPLNRILYAASEKVLHVSSASRTQVLEVINFLEDAEELVEWIPRDMRAVRFNRLNERFKEAFNLACLLLGYTGILGKDMFVFVFNMPKLFEKYIYRVLQREFPQLTAKYQERIGEHLFVDGEQSSVRPDIILEGKRKIPIDVKYEELKAKIPWSHVYQVAFYSKILNSNKAILVYPASDSSTKPIRVELRDVRNPLDIYLLRYNLTRVFETGRPDHGFVRDVNQILSD